MKSLLGENDITTMSHFAESLRSKSSNWVNMNGVVQNFNFSNSFTFNGKTFSVAISGKNKKDTYFYTAKVIVDGSDLLSLRIFINARKGENQIIIYYLKIKNLEYNLQNKIIDHIQDLLSIVKMAFCKILLYIKNNNYRSVNSSDISVVVLSNYHENKPILDSILKNLTLKRIDGELDLFHIKLDNILSKCSKNNFSNM